ncbi:MAG: hypothetical protein KGH95_08090 [Thaumarchaeota archaeon]|nr:hypothetical protein [Nitrososphaerota archaeon]
MAIPVDVKTAVEKNMELMTGQTRTYLPFLKVAFPNVKDFSELIFNMMVGNALTMFVSQYAMRMQSPSEEDFAEFGKIAEPYRKKIKELF